MKLLNKINIRYLLFSLTLLILLGLAFNFVLFYIISEELDEKLLHIQKRVTAQIINENFIPVIKPYIEVVEVANMQEQVFFSDTIIENLQEKEGEEFRQLTSIKKINGKTYKIIVRESKLESDELFESIALIIFLAFIVLVLILFIVNSQIAKSVWLPFYNNLKLVKKFSLNDLSPLRLKPTNIKEFNELNNVIFSLTEKVISDYKSVKQFSENASHEIQTPLTIIRAKLESLINGNGLNIEQLEKVKSIYSSVHRLSKLNKSLLLLTKIENRQFSDVEKISISKVVKEKLSEFKELISLKNLQLETNLNEDILKVMSPLLADLLVNNLISNSINHNKEKGNIKINIKGRQLIISNSGDSPLSNPENIFERFYKENQTSKSVGLGLAIVKKICDTYNIKISYSFIENLNYFTLDF
ncbi:MAG: HAMP domain-containing histidine kinase [Bacteroidales bacterium]|nr:HAMP domain-containing histidine kinase [Bacteroidales bacterium]